MKTFKTYQVDAFTSELFGGNPAAVVPYADGLTDEQMQKIAAENNLSETAFVTRNNGKLNIRWMTPVYEVDLCGHATLATAHVMFNHENFEGNKIEFSSRSGMLSVSKSGENLELNFPATKYDSVEIPEGFADALGVEILEFYKSDDFMAILKDEDTVKGLKPDLRVLEKYKSRGIMITAKGDSVDFVSRFFAPCVGIDEDPVTGSAHCMLAPYWAERLGKKELDARQVSARGGELKCVIDGDRVRISGKAITYLKGEFYV